MSVQCRQNYATPTLTLSTLTFDLFKWSW